MRKWALAALAAAVALVVLSLVMIFLLHDNAQPIGNPRRCAQNPSRHKAIPGAGFGTIHTSELAQMA
jgi:hypothetical protein